MSEQGLRAAQQKMADAQISQAAIDVFTAYYHQLEEGVTGFIAEDSIEPLLEPDLLSNISIAEEQAAQALAGTVVIKLNGGLGTSMGMDRAKSLLPVRDGRTFLDIIVEQVRAARARYGVKLPLLFMNSFRTSEDTREALARFCEERLSQWQRPRDLWIVPEINVNERGTISRRALAERYLARGGAG